VPFDLVAEPAGQPIMQLPPFDRPLPLVTIRPDGAEGPGLLPMSLAKLPTIPVTLPAVSQELIMNMFRDKEGMMPLIKAGLGMDMDGAVSPMKAMPGMDMASRIDPAVVARVTKLIEEQPAMSAEEQLAANGINGKPFALGKSDFAAPFGQVLRWRISEGDDTMPHPVHIHGCQFRIVSQRGQPPEAYRAGWKDTAPISGGGDSQILLNFPHPAGPDAPYMAHCHILEHEDSGMMASFTVA
jgi:blue copper oxidase